MAVDSDLPCGLCAVLPYVVWPKPFFQSDSDPFGFALTISGGDAGDPCSL